MEGSRTSFDTRELRKESEEYLFDNHDHGALLPKSHIRRWSWLCPAFLCGLFGGLIIATIPWIFSHNAMADLRSREIAGEFNGLVPKFTIEPKVFTADLLATVDHETEGSSNATAANWLSYMPVGNGFLSVEYDKSYNLPPPIKYNGRSVYSVAYTHQLHCLYSIMAMYNGLLEGSMKPLKSHNHIDHCFRYLRQSILCCGDTALEGQDPRTTRAGTDGTGAIHLCKSWNELVSWTESRRLNELKVI
ncbi:hypothetical protein BR93DRAFT_78837 [Coniochaeta sp. PMI_546]|nr:hypothetical protein BR93DRAFT_78837 [Coniochaeta sp. PMI_546]